MTPDTVAAVGAIITLVDKMSSWPLGGVVLLMLIGPWLAAIILTFSYRRRYEEVVRMYESNVTLVTAYDKLSCDLKDVIILNTQNYANLAGKIDANQYCPAVRLQKAAQGRLNDD